MVVDLGEGVSVLYFLPEARLAFIFLLVLVEAWGWEATVQRGATCCCVPAPPSVPPSPPAPVVSGLPDAGKVMLFLFNTQDEISYSAHLGGAPLDSCMLQMWALDIL